MHNENHVTGTEKAGDASSLFKWGMAACCAVMFVPIAIYLAGGGSIVGLWSNVDVFAPLALCSGAHVVMHKIMGKSCHGNGESGEAKQDAPATVHILGQPEGKRA